MRKILLTFFAVVLPLAAAWPIGRSGNGKMMSVEDGFSTALPTQLPDCSTKPDGRLVCVNNGITDSNHENPKVAIHRFAIANPDRAALDRDTLRLDLLNNDWHPQEFASDRCVDLYVRDQGSVLALIGVWGPGKGLEVIGARNSFTQTAINEIVAGLKLDAGACAWK